MSDLTAFLLARLDEDEREAWRWAADAGGGDWDQLEDRVLAEVSAKRAIVNEHGFDFVAPAGAESSWEEFASCRTCRGDVGEYPCPTLRHLAAVYADHPDYRDEWRP